jgi:RNA polymerase sigma factor (sigma-70 family)
MDGLQELRCTLVRRLIRWGTGPQDAEDVVHEAFVRLYAAQRKLYVHNPAAFLTDVVGKVRIERWRRAQRARQLFVEEPVEEIDAIDPSPRPEECIQAEQRFDRLSKRLRALGPRARDVLFLHRLEGLTCPEIAAQLGISVSAIEKHIARSIAAIADERYA